MIKILSENPLLLLFIVAAIGYAVGNIKIRGTSLGVSAVLFFGLFIGGISPELKVPEIVFLLGLTIFCYTIGLASGQAFFKNIRKNGIRDILFILLMLTISGSMTLGIHFLFGFDPAVTAGLFAGSSTNTPALAGLLDTISKSETGGIMALMQQQAVVGYSLSYPMGVLGVMLAISIMIRFFKVDLKKEQELLEKEYPIGRGIDSKSIVVQNSAIADRSLRELIRQYKWKVVFGRTRQGEEVFLPNFDTRIQLGDILTIVGAKEELEKAKTVLGAYSDFTLSEDASTYQVSRIFVSNPKIAGNSIATLNITEQYSAIITRVRRGDVDVLANSSTVLELGDRIRFVALKKDLPALRKMFGDSYDASSRIDLFSFGLGMAIGLLLGMVTFTLPGDIKFSLGFAGGPLIIGLILGSLRRSGPIVWTLPYSANLTLRQFGLILLLASIGIQSGHTFFSTFSEGGEAGYIFLAGTIISCVSAFITLWIGYKLVKIPFSFLMGMVSNQPAILEFSMQKTNNPLPTFGYTIMFPIALIIKIVYVQLIFNFLY